MDADGIRRLWHSFIVVNIGATALAALLYLGEATLFAYDVLIFGLLVPLFGGPFMLYMLWYAWHQGIHVFPASSWPFAAAIVAPLVMLLFAVQLEAEYELSQYREYVDENLPEPEDVLSPPEFPLPSDTVN